MGVLESRVFYLENEIEHMRAEMDRLKGIESEFEGIRIRVKELEVDHRDPKGKGVKIEEDPEESEEENSTADEE
jgi:hypothetical protein